MASKHSLQIKVDAPTTPQQPTNVASRMMSASPSASGWRDPAPSPRAIARIDRVAIARQKLDELFLRWMGRPETLDLVRGLLHDVKSGRALAMPGGASVPSSPASGRTSSDAAGIAAPPRSPSRAPGGRGLDAPQSPSSPMHFTFGERGAIGYLQNGPRLHSCVAGTANQPPAGCSN